jgi:hypothetical protein
MSVTAVSLLPVNVKGHRQMDKSEDVSETMLYMKTAISARSLSIQIFGSVGIATGYGLDCLGIESRLG